MDITEYRQKLLDVDDALQDDQDNSELRKLQEELKILIDLMSRSETSQTRLNYQINDNVLAQWASDGRFYPAKITAITGSATKPAYTVTFKKYRNIETVSELSIRPIQENGIARDDQTISKSRSPNRLQKNIMKNAVRKFKPDDEVTRKRVNKWQEFASSSVKSGRMNKTRKK